jgi:hypothetical protein
MNIEKYINLEMKYLFDDYYFKYMRKEFDGDDFIIILSNGKISIKIQNYFREIYTYAHANKCLESEAAIVNIVNYQNIGKTQINDWNYFHEIEDLENAFENQIKCIAIFIKMHISDIFAYFETSDIEERANKLREYIIQQNPSTFKTI